MQDDTDYSIPGVRNRYVDGVAAGFIAGVLLTALTAWYVLG